MCDVNRKWIPLGCATPPCRGHFWKMRCHLGRSLQALGLVAVVLLLVLVQRGSQDNDKDDLIKERALKDAGTVAMTTHKPFMNLVLSADLKNMTNCATMHVLVPMVTEKERRGLTVLLKSLLIQSRSRDLLVVLHLPTTAEGHVILKHLMDSWELPQVLPLYYVVDQTTLKAGSLTDAIRAVLLLIPEAERPTQLIAIRPDVFFLSDLGYVWSQLARVVDGRMLVRLVSTTKVANGIVLYDAHLTRTMVTKATKSSGCLLLFKDDPMLKRSVDQQALLYYSCSNSSNPKDSAGVKNPQVLKIDEVSVDSLYGPNSLQFGQLAEAYLNMVNIDGDLFRTLFSQCAPDKGLASAVDSLDRRHSCYEYIYSAKLKRRVHLAFAVGNQILPSSGRSKKTQKSNNKLDSLRKEAAEARETAAHALKPHTNQSAAFPRSIDVTLVTQLLFNRISNLERLLTVWAGPAEVVLYVTDKEAVKFADYVQQSPVLRSRNATYHIVYARYKYYPINVMRNLGIEQVKTSHYLMLDVDFVPPPKAYATMIDVLCKLTVVPHRAFIVPTFETSNASYTVPSSKEQFVKDWSNKMVLSYHQQDGMWSQGHAYTNYRKWKTSDIPYKVTGKFGFEPYMIVPRNVPLYDDILLERMRDKLTYTVRIERMGYEMFVIPSIYVVHLPHPKSESHSYGSTARFLQCSKKLYEEVLKSPPAWPSQGYPAT